MTRFYRGLPIFVWTLLGILGLAGALLSLGARDDETKPSADSFGPSGTSAMAEILRENGYEVRIDRWSRPRLRPGDVAVAFQTPVNRSEDTEVGLSLDQFNNFLRSQVRDGVHAVVFRIGPDFLADSRATLKNGPSPVTPRGGQHFQLDLCPITDTSTSPPDGVSAGDPNVGLWDTESGGLVRAYQIGKGRMLSVEDGIFATNRFIDRDDDARAVLDLIRMVAPPGARVVFTEAAHGDSASRGLFESIGAWANAGWQQFLFLGLVVAFTLGKRFGIPDETRPPQRGSRELLDALADTYVRGRHVRVALESARDRLEARLRIALRAPRDVHWADLRQDFPSDLRETLGRLREAALSEERIPAPDALELIRRARRETETFLADRRRSTRLPSEAEV